MKRALGLSLTLLVFIAFMGCATKLKNFEPKNQEEASIKKLLLKWESTWNNHDVEGHLSLWNEKAQIMYGKNRKTATKEEYTKILPERMRAYPEIELGAPAIELSQNEANATLSMMIGNHQTTTTFHLVKENDRWSIISWNY